MQENQRDECAEMTELNREAWRGMVQEDIDWLEGQAVDKNSLEYRHILDCMRWLKDNKPEGKHGKGKAVGKC